MKYFSVEKKRLAIKWSATLTVKISGNLEASRRRRGWFPPNVPADREVTSGDPHLQGSMASYLRTSPRGLCRSRRAHEFRGLWHCWGTPEALKGNQGRWRWKCTFSTLCFPWGQEGQFILKTPNGTHVINTCISRNLLLVPPKIQFIKFEMTQKREGECLFCRDLKKNY